MNRLKLIIMLVLFICLLTGCQQESQEENIQNCINMNGKPKITYCSGSSNTICKVECFIEKVEDNE